MGKYNINDVIKFKHRTTGYIFTVTIQAEGDEWERYDCLLNKAPTADEGEVRKMTLSDDVIEVIEVETLKMNKCKYQMAKYANCIDEALRTNDEKWFKRSTARYKVWEHHYNKAKGELETC